MKIVITGANGAFGGAMCRYFSKKNYQVIACGRQTEPPAELREFAEYVQVDLEKEFKLPDGDILIHAAANSDDKATMNELTGPNIEGTRRIAEASEHFKKFIFISSSSVYLPQALPIAEEIAGKQNNRQLSPYGLSKLKSEEILQQVTKHETCFILRARAFYGPGDTQIVPRLLKLVKNQTFTKPGELNIHLSMTHYINMGHAIECCIQSDLKGIHIYNVADKADYVMRKVLKTYFDGMYKSEIPERQVSLLLLKILAFFRIGGFTPLLVRALTQNMVLDIRKIERELHYNPPVDFYSTLTENLAWIDSVGGPEKLREPEKGLCWKNPL